MQTTSETKYIKAKVACGIFVYGLVNVQNKNADDLKLLRKDET